MYANTMQHMQLILDVVGSDSAVHGAAVLGALVAGTVVVIVGRSAERRGQLARGCSPHRGLPQPAAASMPSLPSGTPGAPVATGQPACRSSTPTTGARLTTRKGASVVLGRQIGSGGEARIFETDTPEVVAKVFIDPAELPGRRKKLEGMLSRLSQRPGLSKLGNVCFPRGLLLTANGFCGYLMNRASGDSLSALLIPEVLRARHPEWTRLTLVDAATRILETIQALHADGFIIGDLNLQNILLDGTCRPWFVDVDSFQFGAFACPVGTPHFTPPELQGKALGKLLRTPHHEMFAVAALIFMVVFLGKQPYAQRGGGTPAENIRSGRFPYTVSQTPGPQVPDGPWWTIWQSLPLAMRQGFVTTFTAGAVSRRLSVPDWLTIMRAYRADLVNGQAKLALVP